MAVCLCFCGGLLFLCRRATLKLIVLLAVCYPLATRVRFSVGSCFQSSFCCCELSDFFLLRTCSSVLRPFVLAVLSVYCSKCVCKACQPLFCSLWTLELSQGRIAQSNSPAASTVASTILACTLFGSFECFS